MVPAIPIHFVTKAGQKTDIETLHTKPVIIKIPSLTRRDWSKAFHKNALCSLSERNFMWIWHQQQHHSALYSPLSSGHMGVLISKKMISEWCCYCCHFNVKLQRRNRRMLNLQWTASTEDLPICCFWLRSNYLTWSIVPFRRSSMPNWLKWVKPIIRLFGDSSTKIYQCFLPTVIHSNSDQQPLNRGWWTPQTRPSYSITDCITKHVCFRAFSTQPPPKEQMQRTIEP